MPVFDVHSHVFPEKVCQRAIDVMVAKSHGLPPFSDGTRAGQERHALEAGYDGWLNCPVVTSVHQMHSVNEWVASWNAWPHPSLGGLYPNAPLEELLKECDRIRELGLWGVKLHPEYQQFQVLDERLRPMWQRLSDQRLPVLFHAGDDMGYMGLPKHSSPAAFARLSEEFPDLTIICAHMGGWRNWNEVESCLCGCHVYLDTSFAKPWMTDQEQFERIIRKHGIERVLFGTDSPWSPLPAALLEVEETGLSAEEKADIFYNNAARIFPLPKLA